MTISISDRFWSKVDKTGACWVWLAAKYSNGYGAFWLNPYQTTAHRVAYILTYGPIEDNSLVVCHSCDNRLCVNPAHLFLGTQKENIHDMFSKGRQAKGKSLNHRTQVGSNNHAAKLNEEIVTTIRNLFAAGISQADIARTTGVSRLNIWNVVHRKSWTHI